MKTDRKIEAEKSPPKVKTIKENKRAAPKLNGRHPLVAYEHIPVGIVEASLDGKFVDVNEEFCRILGYSRKELLRRGIKNSTHEDDYEIDQRLYQQLIVGKVPFYRLEKRFIRKDGGIVWVELTRSLVNDAKGKPLYTVGVVLDISDRKDVEKVLHDSVERLRLATGTAQMFMWEWDFQTQSYTIADNFEKVLGFSAGLFPRNNLDTVWALSPKEDVQRIAESFEKAVENQSDLHALPCRVVNPENGDIVWLEVSAKIIYDSDGNPRRMFGVAQNITESKRAEAALTEFGRQQEALYKLSDQLHRTESFADIFDAALDAILSALQCDRASVLLFDEKDVMRFVAWRGLSDVYRKATDGHSPWKPDAKDPEPLPLEDVRTADLDEALRAVILDEGIGSLAFIPLVFNGKLMGKFMIYFNTPHAFNKAELDLSLTIAHQLASAVDRKRAADALERERELLERLFETMPVMVSMIDPISNSMRLNAEFERQIGWKNEEVTVLSLLEALYPDSDYRNQVLQRMATAVGKDEWVEVQVQTRDGRSLDSMWSNISIMEDQKLVMGIAIGIDITERKQTEKRLALLAEISEVLRNVEDTHELMYTISKTIGKHLGVKRVLFNEIDLEHDREIVHNDYHNGLESVAGIHRVSAYSSVTSAEVAAGKTVVNMDSKTDPRTSQDYERTYAQSGERSYVVVPMMRENRWVASLWVSDDEPRNWSNEEVSMLETIAERTWTVIEKLRIAAELRAKEAELEDVINQTPFMLTRCTRDLRYRFVSRAYAEMIGRKAEEIAGKPIVEIMGEEGLNTISPYIEKVLQGNHVEYENEVPFRDIGTPFLHVAYTPDWDTQGNVVGWFASIVDITERKRAEEALRRNEQMFSTLVDAAPFGVYFIDSEFRLRSINKGAEAVFSGIDPLIGRDFAEILRIIWQEPFATESIERFRHTLRTGESFISPPVVEPRANIDEIEAYDWQIHRIVLPDGTYGVVCYFYDLSEQKRMEATVRASEELYRTIARSIPGGGVYVVDKDFRYLVAEGPVTEAFGLTREMLEGRTVSEVFPGAQGERMEERLKQNFAGEEASFETEHNGRFYWTQQASLLDSIGQVIIVTMDITERKRAENSLRQSEERFARFMHHLPGLAWIKDLDGRYVYANAAAEKAFNTSREQLYGKTDEDIFPPDAANQFRQNDQQALADERGVQVIEMLEQQDGVLHYSLVNKFPIPGPDGKTALIGGTAFDITERRQAEEALRESEARLRAVFDGTYEYIGLLSPDGTLLEANRAALEFDNDTREDVVGRPFWETSWWIYTPGAPEALRQSIQQAADGEFIRYEAPLNRRSGETIIFDFSLHPIRDENGKVVFLVPEGRNITERRKTEEALRESEERFSAILRQATAGIVRKDAHGRLLFVNQAFCNMLGYTESELLGKTIWDFMHPDDIAENRRSYDRLMLEGIPFKLERRFLRQDGSLIWVDASVSPIMDSTGKPQSAVAVEADITGRKLAEEALRELNLQLEDRILSRTAKLREVNQTLREEIGERQRVEEALRQSEALARANEEKLSTLFELLPVGISFLDPEGQIIQVNPALTNILKLPTQLSEQTYRSRNYIRANGTRMLPTEFASQRALREGKTVYNLETGVILEDGEVIWTSVSAAPVNVADVGAVIVTADITESKRAERALQESRERLQILSQRLVEVQEEERRAIARELHDRVGQTLAALNINLIIISGQLGDKVDAQVSSRLSDSMKLVAETIALVRDVMSNLRPSVLDDYGLEAAIDSHLNQFTSRYELQVKFEKPKPPIPRLGSSIEMTFLRIAQEALMNIARHAQATQVNLSLWQEGDAICMTVQDNGTGIISWESANRPGSHGMTIMRERAEAVGGNLKVSSVPGKGTKIEVKVPIETNAQPHVQEGKSQ